MRDPRISSAQPIETPSRRIGGSAGYPHRRGNGQTGPHRTAPKNSHDAPCRLHRPTIHSSHGRRSTPDRHGGLLLRRGDVLPVQVEVGRRRSDRRTPVRVPGRDPLLERARHTGSQPHPDRNLRQRQCRTAGRWSAAELRSVRHLRRPPACQDPERTGRTGYHASCGSVRPPAGIGGPACIRNGRDPVRLASHACGGVRLLGNEPDGRDARYVVHRRRTVRRTERGLRTADRLRRRRSALSRRCRCRMGSAFREGRGVQARSAVGCGGRARSSDVDLLEAQGRRPPDVVHGPRDGPRPRRWRTADRHRPPRVAARPARRVRAAAHVRRSQRPLHLRRLRRILRQHRARRPAVAHDAAPAHPHARAVPSALRRRDARSCARPCPSDRLPSPGDDSRRVILPGSPS